MKSFDCKIVKFPVAVFLVFMTGQVAVAANDDVDFFESKVRPLLIEHCYECHSTEAGESSGELLIDSAVGLRTGGSHGPALVPNEPDNSLLIRAVEYKDSDMQMPPAGKLDDGAIAVLKAWIASGATDPRESTAIAKSPSPIERDPKSHWSFVKPERPHAPESSGENDRDALDAWASAAAAAKGARVNPSVDDATLMRRLYFDLTGLPPTNEELADYQNSKRPDRYTRLVDSLLASPEFAERFARHWLDVARYADTVGYDFGGKDRRYKGSERYRDWTVGAFAADMPYDQMIRHQLAGDRTDPQNVEGNLDAMGFLTLGRKFINGLDTTDDRIDVITRGLLGLTVACARCHDHKFDPIPTTDYYSLFGILSSSRQPEDGASPLMMVDEENAHDRPVFLRGQQGNHGPIAPRQFLTSLRKDDEPRFNDGSGRWELALRIVADDNPLTARVMVNRLWGHLIGKPLVDSPSDFGFRTARPEVPEVLDELAVDFASHWSIKRTVRRIVLTRIYRQSATKTPDDVAIDPDNRLLARGNRKRRDFESLRDSLLYVAGSLDHQMGGPPVEITGDVPTPRRSVYAMIDRQNLPSLFRTFDFAGPDTHSPQRYFTTVPQQALFLLNSPQMFALAKSTADSVRKEAEDQSDEAVARRMFLRVLRREPTTDEISMATEFVRAPVSESVNLIDARSMWSYGVATLGDERQVVSVEKLAHFGDNRWQMTEAFPAESPYGHAFFDRENGHTPRGSDLGVVRRFTVPAAGSIELNGEFHHHNQGDGVNAVVWIAGKQVFAGNVKEADQTFTAMQATVKAGDTVDFVISPGANDSFDSFVMRATIRLTTDDGTTIESQSVRDFAGPEFANPASDGSDRSMNRLAQLAQVLMMSNEFAFVD